MRTRAVAFRAAGLAALLAVLAGCSNGQLVDAGGDRGGGGMAFVLLALVAMLFVGFLFSMDRYYKSRGERDRRDRQD